MCSRRLQIRGELPDRRFVPGQPRTAAGEFDRHIDGALARVEALILGHGVFHAQAHFSSGQVTLWLLSDPLRYRVHVQEEFLDPDIVLAYPRQPYTAEAVVPSPQIPKVLAELKRLRALERRIRLCAGSLNVVNGLVGLDFSGDGHHYLGYAEFLTRARELYG
jgi:hypothetical protein